jgi:hydroxyacylglutathione hydrolase
MLTMETMNVHQIPARKDNYIYLLEDADLDHCAVIDATDFGLIKNFCESRKKRLSSIFVTHHHEDHINAIGALSELYHCQIYAAAHDTHRITGFTHTVKDNDTVFYGPHPLKVISTPGHTLGHISYYHAESESLFCGDVIFRFGCGRLFEGTPQMMLTTLSRLRELPSSTTVYCAHEYTQANVAFCKHLEPQNSYFKNFKQAPPTVPFPLQEQKDHSPFFRWDDPSLRNLLQTSSDMETFAKVRELRNRF